MLLCILPFTESAEGDEQHTHTKAHEPEPPIWPEKYEVCIYFVLSSMNLIIMRGLQGDHHAKHYIAIAMALYSAPQIWRTHTLKPHLVQLGFVRVCVLVLTYIV